jgi:uncharacterized protein (DUF58 family)
MLPADLIKRIKKVHIRTGRAVNTLMAGQYKSVFRGTGIEFEEVRPYAPGDDVRSIDWKVSARFGRPYIKRYREERERIVMLLVDVSASVRFGTRESTKQEIAAEIAAVLAFNAVRNNDKVGAILFTEQVEQYIPPKKGNGHVWRIIKEIFTHAPRHSGTDLSGPLDFFGRVCRKRTVAFVISDFMLPRGGTVVDRRMRALGRKHELIHVLVSDPGEFALPFAGILNIRDLETSRLMQLDASDARTRREYTRRRRAAYGAIGAQFKAAKLDCIEINTAASAAEALGRYFHYRERRKR